MGSNIQKPTLSVQNVRVDGFDFQHVDLTYDLLVENPNNVALNLLRYNYQLDVNDNSFLKGQQQERTEISASGQTVISVPISVNYADLYAAVSGLKGSDDVSYSFLSTLTFDLPLLGQTDIPIEKSGEIPLLQIPNIRITDFQINKLSFSGAAVKLQMEVNNPNGFGVTVNGLDYRLNINGDRWSDGTALQGQSINPNSTTMVDVPLSLSFSDIGMSAFRALSSSSPLNYQLDGTANLDLSHELLGETSFNFNQEGTFSLPN